MVELSPSEGDNQYSQGFAGDVFNTGIYLKRCLTHQAKVSFLSVIGKDRLSNQLLDFMQQEQISSEHLYYVNDEGLGLYMINLDNEGERSFTYWRDNSPAKQLMRFVGTSDASAFNKLDSVFFSGISLAILPSQDLSDFWLFIEKLKHNGSKIVFDPNYRQHLWSSSQVAQCAIDKAYSLSDIVLAGVEDHRELYHQQTAEAVASHIASLGVKEIIIKQGAKTVLTHVNGSYAEISIPPVKYVIDTTSAGDAFNAGYLSARIQGMPFKDSVLYGAKVAGIVIQHKGAILPANSFNNIQFLNEDLI